MLTINPWGSVALFFTGLFISVLGCMAFVASGWTTRDGFVAIISAYTMIGTLSFLSGKIITMIDHSPRSWLYLLIMAAGSYLNVFNGEHKTALIILFFALIGMISARRR